MTSRQSIVVLAVAALVLLVAPLAVYPILLMKILCFALFAAAFNLVLGFSGLLSFGHAAFFGVAAYVCGHALTAWGLPTPAGIALGTLVALALGWLFGLFAIGRQGIYFAMITLALAQLIFIMLLKAPFTGGEDGLQGVPRGTLFGLDLTDDLAMYYVVAAVFAGGLWVVYRTVNSPFGEVLKAIRENEPRAVSLGYDVARYKYVALVLSAGLSGLAGATKVVVFQFATLSDSHWHTSGEVVLMSLLGGVGSVFGPVAGAAVIVTLHNELSERAGSLVGVILGAIFIACVLLFRRGLLGEAQALWRRVIGEKAP